MKNKTIFRYLFALSLYGTIGLFLHFIDYSSEFVVLCRGLLGSLFIFIVMCIRKNRFQCHKTKPPTTSYIRYSFRIKLDISVCGSIDIAFNDVFIYNELA